MEELNRLTLQQAIRGDKVAFRAVYDRYAPFVWRVLLRMTADELVAQELLQETFIKVHSALKKFKGESALSTWIYRIAFNAVISHTKKRAYQKLHAPYQDTHADPDTTDSYETRQLVGKILAELSVQERFLLVSREVDGFSFEDIASITGTAPGTLRTKLHRIKERIRNNFRETKIPLEAVL